MLNRIENEIERVAQMNGVYFPSDESVTISMILTDAEKSEFLELDLNEHYYWELDGNELFLTYEDNSITLDQVIENIRSIDISELEESEIINEIIISYQDYQVCGVSEVIVNCERKDDDIVVYESYINHVESPILKTVIYDDVIISVDSYSNK